jgi:hypothetical protein
MEDVPSSLIDFQAHRNGMAVDVGNAQLARPVEIVVTSEP